MELPSEATVRAIVQRLGRLRARLKLELGERPLVLPNGDFFPDAFGSDTRSVSRLVKRMQRHAGIDDIPIRVRLVGDPAAHGGGCGSGACATPLDQELPPRIVDDGEGWIFHVPEAELKHPVVLTANLARGLGYVFLMETRREDEPLDEPLEVTVDLTAVLLGFGVLLMDGSYIYQKGCGGVSVGRVTKLGPADLAIALGLFGAAFNHKLRRAERELPATQQALLGEARALFDSNPELGAALRDAPERLAEGEFKLEEQRAWLVRVFGGKKRESTEGSIEELESMLATLPVTGSAPKKRPSDPKRDELRALVDEALADAGDAE
jgi:hypothetical protein